MKKITYSIFLLLGLMCLQGCSGYTELEVNGPSNEKLDIVLIPSHFYGQDPGSNSKWIEDADMVSKRLLEHHFWSKYRNRINVYRLDVSIDDDFKDNGGGHWVPDDKRIKAFALEHFSFLDFNQNDQIIFIIESGAYFKDPIYEFGRTRGDPNIVKLETSFIPVVVHEFGHAFGRLEDEYAFVTSISDWKSKGPNNASLTPGDKCEDKWNDLMNVVYPAPGTQFEEEFGRIYRMVGCYLATKPESPAQGFRPADQSCIMNQGGELAPFCPVCQRQLVTLLDKYTPSDKNLYDKVETFQSPAKFMEATQNPAVINFDRAAVFDAKTGKPLDSTEPLTDIVAPDEGTLASGIYADAGIHFTAGVILKQPFGNNPATPPNALGATALNPKERALVAGYFLSRRICAIGIYNTGFAPVTLSSYNAAFFQTATATFVSNADTNTFIGLRATEPIYRFEISAPSAKGFSVDNLYFGECPK